MQNSDPCPFSSLASVWQCERTDFCKAIEPQIRLVVMPAPKSRPTGLRAAAGTELNHPNSLSRGSHTGKRLADHPLYEASPFFHPGVARTNAVLMKPVLSAPARTSLVRQQTAEKYNELYQPLALG